MRFRYSLLFIVFAFAHLVNAQPNILKISEEKVAPGMKLTRYEIPSRPCVIHVLEIDAKNPFTSFMTVASNDKTPDLKRETVGSISKRYTKPGQTVVGAINSDFFDYSLGIANGIQVSEGVFVKSGNTDHDHSIGLDVNNKPFLVHSRFSGVVNAKGASFKLNGINFSYNDPKSYGQLTTDRIVLYNHYFGTSSRNTSGEKELLLKPIDKWNVNAQPVRCIVIDSSSVAGSLKMDESTVIIAGSGKGKDFISTITKGDTIALSVGLTIGPSNVKEMIGINPTIVLDGKNYAVQGWEYMWKNPSISPYSRDPLSAMGFSRDSSKIFFVNCDGRNPSYSNGLSIYELADFMISLGVYNAGHFDSGGSAELVIRNEIKTIPSDGAERPIMNAFLVNTSAPTDKLDNIQATPSQPRLFTGDKFKIKVKGCDKYYNPIAIDSSKITYTLTKNIGTISKDGEFTAGSSADNGSIIVDYQGLKDTVNILIKTITRISLSPKEFLTNSIATQKVTLTAYDSDDVVKLIDSKLVKWSVNDPSLGTVDSLGNFRGLKTGTAYVIANYLGVKDTCKFNVVVEEGTRILNSFDAISGLSISGSGIDTLASKFVLDNSKYSEGKNSLKMIYKFTYKSGTTQYIYLNTDIAMRGIPDSLLLDCMSNGLSHRLYYKVEDANGNPFTINARAYANSKSTFSSIPAQFSYAVSSSGAPLKNYPAKIKQIYFKLESDKQDGKEYTDSLYIDNLRIVYPKVTTGIKKYSEVPQNFQLLQNYPNPFNPETCIGFNLDEQGDVSLKIYDFLGREVATLIHGQLSAGHYEAKWNASGFASGVYFCQLRLNNRVAIKKMLLFK
ncbi:MAG: phosphodiester glycosidase family protein [Bacteroidota bacterium]|nr:phosphodiester glycosidase family protein [Bacteroidota bacterium]